MRYFLSLVFICISVSLSELSGVIGYANEGCKCCDKNLLKGIIPPPPFDETAVNDCVTYHGSRNVPLSVSTNYTHQHHLFETLSKEIENVKCEVEGTFPPWLAGSFYKNGFGKFESSKANYSFVSLFDVMSYVVRIHVNKNNEVFATAKFSRSDWYNRSEGENGYSPHNPPFRSFLGTYPDLDFFAKLRMLTTILADNYNFNIVRQGKRLFEISDMDGFLEVSMDNLDVVGHFKYNDNLSHTTSILSYLGVITCAHPSSIASRPHIVYQYVAYPGGYIFQELVLPIAISAFLVAIVNKMFENQKGKQNSFEKYLKLAIYIGSFLAINIYVFYLIDGGDPNKMVNMYTFYELDTTKEPLTRVPIISFPVNRLTYLHEFAQTENYLVVAEWPMYWNVGKLANIFFNDASKLILSWMPEKGTNIHVIDLRTKKIVKKYTLPAYWSYHHINAYEDNKGDIVMDVVTMDSGEHLASFQLNTLKSNALRIWPSITRRFHIPVQSATAGSTVKVDIVGPIGFDLPVRNMELAGYNYKFAYGNGHRRNGDWWNCIVKVNMDTGKTDLWYEPNTWPTQSFFIPRPKSAGGTGEEDDGILLTVVLDAEKQKSFLLALDGKTFEEVARAWIPVGLPYTSHGYYDVAAGGDPNQTMVPGLKNNFSFTKA